MPIRLNGNGGIFVSDDNGRTFKRVGMTSSTACTSCNDMVNDFLALAYDKSGQFLYAGRRDTAESAKAVGELFISASLHKHSLK